jgi:hypothetical protein
LPGMRISTIYWPSTTHATRRASVTEIEEVLLSSATTFRRNLPGRAGTHLAVGRTAAGRPLTVAFIYLREQRTAIPVTAWEN